MQRVQEFTLATLSSFRVTDEFRFCCAAHISGKCRPEPDEFSSCTDLMSNYVLRVSIWVLGLTAFWGNIVVIVWRTRDLRNGKVMYSVYNAIFFRMLKYTDVLSTIAFG